MFSACLCLAAESVLSTMATIRSRIDDELKAALDRYRKEHGLKRQAVVSEALASWLEDADDLEEVEERRSGPWDEWASVRKTL